MPPRSQRPIAAGDGLVLRPWRAEDAPALLSLLGDPETTRWLGASHVRPLMTLDEARRRVRDYADLTLSPPLGVWAVVPGDVEPVGTVMLVQSSESFGDVEVGWYLRADARGRGLATRAARAALEHGFGAGLTTVAATTRPDNVASHAVCARLGMRDDGEERDATGEVVRRFVLTRRVWRQRAAVPST